MDISGFTKEFFLNELDKIIQNQEYRFDFYHMINAFSFEEEYEELSFEYEEYEYLLIRIIEYLEDVDDEISQFNIDIIKYLHLLITKDLLDEEYIYSLLNYDVIDEIIPKYKKNILTFETMSSHLNKNYQDEFKMEISKIMKIYDDGIFKSLGN